jgi:hypothetical protein
MAEHWSLISDLRGGTIAMRKAGVKWLPQEPNEEPAQYAIRLGRSVLFNGYADTVDRLAGKPYLNHVVVENPPEALKEVADNVDGTGQDITALAHSMTVAMLDYGLTHLFVDFSAVPKAANRGEELKSPARPYFNHVLPNNLLGWRTQTIDGVETLVQVRVQEIRLEAKGLYGDEEVKYVRVFNAPTPGFAQPIILHSKDGKGNEKAMVLDPNEKGLGTWELWRWYEDDDEFRMVEQGTHSYPGIPWVTVYAKRVGFMEGVPPLEDLAWLNLLHWQSQSDQRNILRFARVNMMLATGFLPQELQEGIIIGPGRLVKSVSPNAKLSHVEHEGTAISAGRQDLQDLREDMQALGMQPLLRNRPGNQTATGQSIDEANSQSDLQSWIRRLESALEEAYRIGDRWRSKTKDVTFAEDFKVNIFNDFGIADGSGADVDTLVSLRGSRDLSRWTLLREMKRRGVLAESLDVDQEITRIETEVENTDDSVDDDDDEPGPEDVVPIPKTTEGE